MLGEVANRVCESCVQFGFNTSDKGMLRSLRNRWTNDLYIDILLLFIVVIYALLYSPR